MKAVTGFWILCGSKLLVLLTILHSCNTSSLIVIDDTVGLARAFDGIGGLSGGSATSKLLADYKEPQRSEILDYLFTPSFAGSLHILKVEIGGDAQASDATESSHMHNSWDENYQRGYEWWLMKEAKKRNPNIKLYGLPWDFPGWLGNGTRSPYGDPVQLATYIVKWIAGAKTYHNLDIDYIGIWNERAYNITYIKTLRTMLDKNGFENTAIVASDLEWDIVRDMILDPELHSAVDIVGVHYPGTVSPVSAVSLGKPLWSSEDFSTFNDNVGGGCWARILNQNYVNGYMTSTISWNLIDSYLEGLPWDRDSLMTAREPWSGYYSVDSPIWVSAHTTQFATPGWFYLQHDYGVGLLDHGGSIVTLVSPGSRDLTIVIETMSHDHSVCIRPGLPPYNVTAQNITIQLMGSFVDVHELQVWYTKLEFGSKESVYFKKLSPLKVQQGQVQVVLGVDEIYTLTTITTGQKGQHPPPPDSAPFPENYFAFFYDVNDSSEAPYISAQQGVYEVVSVSQYEKHLRQMVLEMPVPWCGETALLNATMAVLGNFNWDDILIRSETYAVAVNGSGGLYIAARIDNAGCDTYRARGLFFFLYPEYKLYLLTNDLAGNEIIKGGRAPNVINSVDNVMELLVSNGFVSGNVNRIQLFNVSIPKGTPAKGFVGLGTDSYGYADFGFFSISNPSDPALWKNKDKTYFSNKAKKDKTLYFSSDYN